MSEGHRKRLRDKFLNSGIHALHDYEVVELLLTLGTPRKDCKQQAKKAINKFKGLKGVLDTPVEELQEIEGIGPRNIFGIKLFQQLTERYLEEKMKDKPIHSLNDAQAVFNYLRQSLNKNKKEVFKVIFLDSKNRVIKVKDLFKGSLTSSPIYPREIMEEAIKCRASSLIFVHNHPSGDINPSPTDKEVTMKLVTSASSIDINVLDHLIVAGDKYFSFADAGLIRKYKAIFKELKCK